MQVMDVLSKCKEGFVVVSCRGFFKYLPPIYPELSYFSPFPLLPPFPNITALSPHLV